MKTEEQVLEYDAQGKVKPVQTKTGKRHLVHLQSPTLAIKRRYHDASPVVEAPFAVEFADGTTLRGILDKNGEARILHL